MTRVAPSFHPTRVSTHVPDMEYAADISLSGDYFCDLGTPPVADTSAVLAAFSATGTAAITKTTDDFLITEFTDHPYGVSVSVTPTATTADRVVTVTGRDYLKQLVTETITLASTATVQTLKAYKGLVSLAIASGANSQGNLTVGFGNKLGLPYKAQMLKHELFNNVVATGTGTFVAGVTGTQTATTGDPRGTIVPAGTLDGTKQYRVAYEPDRSNLHGDEHYSA